MGFDVKTFESILSARFAEKDFSGTIPRDDVNSAGTSRHMVVVANANQ